MKLVKITEALATKHFSLIFFLFQKRTRHMLELYGLPCCAGLRSPSPWVMKVELAMRYLRLDYSLVQPQILRALLASPSRKVPYVLIDGEPIVESERILKALEKHASPRTFPHPDDEDHGSGIAIVRLVEDHLYHIICKSKHADPNTAEIMWAEMFPYPWFPARLWTKLVRQLIWKGRLANTSIGGLSNDEVHEQALKDIQTLAAQLSKKNFIASNGITIYDFTVAAHIASILYWRIDNWLAPLFREHQVLYQYLERVAEAVGGFDYEPPRS